MGEPDIPGGVLGGAVVAIPGSHRQDRGVSPQHIEEAKRCRIYFAVRADGRHQRNRTRHYQAGENWIRPIGKLSFQIKFHGGAACSIWNQSQFRQPFSTMPVLARNVVGTMRKKQQRQKLKAAPFPSHWSSILEDHFPLYARLPDEDRKELHGHIQVFLAEKRFEGCGGLEITEEMKVCIAAQACLLLLHREKDYYRSLRSILLYPGTSFAQATRHVGSGVMEERQDRRLGEAWDSGAVVLAWDAVHAETANPGDGRNVVFHEFAHQLDFEDGRADGAPVLAAEVPWHRRTATIRSPRSH